MIITRTSYPWTAKAVLFRQKIGDAFLMYDFEVDVIGTEKNMILIRECIDGNIKNVYRYVYLSLFGFIGPVCQVFRTEFGIDLCYVGKFIIDASAFFDSSNYD